METEKSELLLSICIPTFNRAAVLDRLLSNIHSQSDGMDGKFEICISDNCSPDKTAEVAEKWGKNLPVTYGRNSSNLGYDRNALAALGMAHGKFVWFIGDDDLLCPGALSSVMAMLSSPDAIGVGAIYLNAMLHRKPMVIFNFGAPKVFLTNSKDYPPLNISFGGSDCIRADLAKKIVKSKIGLSGAVISKAGKMPHLLDDFLNTYLFLECASQSGKLAIVPRPCVEILADFDFVSYERKFYIETIFMAFAFDVRTAYPWVNSSKVYTLKGFLARAALVIMRPSLADQYSLCLALHKKLLSQDNNSFGLMFLNVIDGIRRIPIVREILPISFRLLRKFNVTRITDDEDKSERMKERLKFASARAQAFL